MDRRPHKLMGVRIVNQCYSNVIPLYPNGTPGDGEPDTPTDPLPADEPLPEPVQLYGLTVLAFLLHTPAQLIRRCVRCGTAWPCDHLRLAYRLREGF